VKPKPQVGDWVRFYRGGVLVIGTVEYVYESRSGIAHWNVMTDVGGTTEEEILEIRRVTLEVPR
jgi:hypothetical protein